MRARHVLPLLMFLGTAVRTAHSADAGMVTPALPVITGQPASQTVTVGGTAAFSVVATGTPPLTYQWLKSGYAMAGKTAATYTVAAASFSDGGEKLSVAVTNAAGTVTSSVAVLTVLPKPLVIGAAILPHGIVGRSYVTYLRATGGTAPYTWSLAGGELPTGLGVSSTEGAIVGTPTAAQTSAFTIQVSDSKGSVATQSFTVATGIATFTAPFGHVVIVVLENANYAEVFGSNSAMPYLDSLGAEYGVAASYYGNAHPSIGNYEMLTTGQLLTDDDGKTPASFPISVDNMVRELLANGKTWKAYAESIPSVGYIGSNEGKYMVRHVPFAYFTDVQEVPANRANLVPFTQFSADLADGRLPDLAFVTPNDCDDAHYCKLDVADAWLEANIAPLLTSSPFMSDGVLIVVFDESHDDDTLGGGHLPAVIVSPAYSKRAYHSTTVYQHESAFRLMLEGLGVEAVPGAGATAPSMWEFFDFPSP